MSPTPSRRAQAPDVSLIMPAWNPQPHWLRDAVESALGQTGCAIEVIVVDDGSEVPVAELLEGITDSRLRTLRLPHGGVGRARNAGVEAASGTYFRYVDCDDVIVPDSTAHLLALADGSDSIVTYGATVVCDERLTPLSTVSTGMQGSVYEACLLNRFDTTIHSLLYPRRVAEAVGEWEPTIVVSQDWDYALRAFEIAEVRGDRRVATYYRTHASMNSRNVPEGIRGYERVLERFFLRHPELTETRLARRAHARFHLFAAVQYATVLGSYGAAARQLARAFACDAPDTIRALPRQASMPLAPVAAPLRRFARRRRQSS
jgi:glycosyltransferase involved in cell wall biosynthesis